ncbi:oligo-1,6-glucosidase [Ligilactobacillus agilis]|uniref:Oligo-1,6-glucosidase n=1 Tax=Ligilactobacillus agilis TaxID=1601 RepID=A0A6F9XL13_9LACO|nr:alpha-glucosidase [Ligilactobacillus agilis]GET05939.1 oligo-1,6-glucosidase [Ligilactobacillus agilis]
MSEWWKKSVVYQVYPLSFNDSNNDGVGDLKGIEEKLPYLSKLGIDVVWLNPIFESPLVDNGYDISDYEKILPKYGTMDDFLSLLKEAHKLNIKIILDLVVNHTSNEHRWFKESCKGKENPYSDYYIWKDPREDGSEPNNWGSTFGGSAWEYVPSRGQYYLHCFAKEQPDLNWDNPKVRQSIYKMMTKWFELGIDGFRMDVISLISKNPEYPNAPKEVPYTKSYYVGASNGPKVHEYLHEMNEKVLSEYDVMTVGETPNTTSKQALLYTNPNRKELDMVFHFDHMHLDYGKYGKFSDIKFKMSDLRNVLSKWQKDLAEGWNALYWSNHDQPRAVTRFGNDEKYRDKSAKMLATLLHFMKGTPYIYEGEEIGMKNVPFDSLNDYRDIETKYFIEDLRNNSEPEEYIRKCVYLKSRDNARTPMPWNGNEKEGYGFSNGKPWIKYSPDNKNINVEDALKNPNSIFYYYQKLIKLRKSMAIITEGDFKLLNKDDSDVFSYVREMEEKKLVVICSFASKKVNFELPKELVKHISNSRLIISNYDDSNLELPQKLPLCLRPFESLAYYIEE